MALIFSVVDPWDDGKCIQVSSTIAATGNYTTNGDTLDLSQVPLIASDQPPVQGTGWMDGLAGYDYVFLPGAAMNSNKVKIFQQGSAAGAYPGAIAADTITFYGTFKKLQWACDFLNCLCAEIRNAASVCPAPRRLNKTCPSNPFRRFRRRRYKDADTPGNLAALSISANASMTGKAYYLTTLGALQRHSARLNT